jgi:hypothetical protein
MSGEEEVRSSIRDSEIMECINIIQLEPCEIMWQGYMCGRDIYMQESSTPLVTNQHLAQYSKKYDETASLRTHHIPRTPTFP